MSNLIQKILVVTLVTMYVLYVSLKYQTLKLQQYRQIKPVKSKSHHFNYFVQITDTHITSPLRYDFKPLRCFFDEISEMQPEMVIHTGDITHGVTNGSFNTDEQDFERWKDLKSRYDLNVCEVRGNHDTYGTNEEKNEKIIEKYLGKDRNFYKIIKNGPYKYLFVFIDASPIIGPNRGFNLFGTFTDNVFAEKIDNLKKHENFDEVVTFCHYPSNSVTTKLHKAFSCSYYFCGHFHKLLIFKKIMRMVNGVKEAVLEDFVKGKKYRIFAFYNGSMKFDDFKIGKEPKILILNVEKNSVCFLAFFVDEIKLKVGANVLDVPVSQKENFYSVVFANCEEGVTVSGINEYGMCVRNSKNHNREDFLSSLPLVCDFRIFYLVSALILFVAIFFTHPKISLLPTLYRLVLNIFFIAFFKPCDRWEVFNMSALGDLYSLDVPLHGSIIVFLTESAFLIALKKNCFMIYFVLSAGFASYFWYLFGVTFRIDDFLLVYSYFFIFRNRNTNEFLSEKVE